MPDERIKDLAITADYPAIDDYDVVDGLTNGTRKLPASFHAATAAARAAGWNSFYFDGITSGSRVYWPTPSAQIGTSDFTVVLPIRALNRRNGQTSGLWMFTGNANGDGYGAGAFTVRIDPVDALRIRIGDDTHYRHYSIPAASFWTPFQGRTGDLVVRRAGGVISVDWVEGRTVNSITLPAEVTAGTPPAWSDAITNASFVVGSLFSAAYYFGELGAPRLLNRAWSAGDLAYWALHRRLAASDAIGGSMTSQTSGTLTLRARYRITSAGGTFTGVGAADNNVGTEFVAIGTTPTWSTGAVIALGAMIQPEITRVAQVLDHGPYRIRGVMTNGVRPLCDRDPVGIRGTQSATGFALGLGSSDPLWFETGLITSLRIKQAAASAQTITLRLNTSGGTVIATATTSATTDWQIVALAIPGGFEISAGDRLHWTLTGALDWNIDWHRR